MKERRHKIHYARSWFQIGICGLDGAMTYTPNDMTCRICMFRYLASQAPWAQGFLDDLRRGQSASVIVPARTPEPMDGKVEGTGDGQAGPFGQQRVAQEAISKILPIRPAFERAVKEVMDNGGPAAESIWIQPGQVAEQSWNAGQISDKSSWDNKMD